MSDESDYGSYTTKPSNIKQPIAQPLIAPTNQFPATIVQKNTTVKQNAYLDQKNIKSTFKTMFISGLPTECLKDACTKLKISDYQVGSFQFSGEEYFKFTMKNDAEAKQLMTQGQQQVYTVNGQRVPLTIGYLDTYALNNTNCYVVIKITNGQSTNIKNLYTAFQDYNPVTIRKVADWYLVCFPQEDKALHTIAQPTEDLPCIFERFNDKYQQPFRDYIQIVNDINQAKLLQQKQISQQQAFMIEQPKIQQKAALILNTTEKLIQIEASRLSQQNPKLDLSKKQAYAQQQTTYNHVNSSSSYTDDVEDSKKDAQFIGRPKQQTGKQQEYQQQKPSIQQYNILIQQAIQRQQNELIKLNKKYIKTNIVEYINKSFDKWLKILIDDAEKEILKKMNDAEKYQFNQYHEQKIKIEEDLIDFQGKAKTIITNEINNVIAKQESNAESKSIDYGNLKASEAKNLYKKYRLSLEKMLTDDINNIAKSIEQIK